MSEEKLKQALEAYLKAERGERFQKWKEFCELHAQRSPEVVRQMEQEKGLL